MEKLLTNSQECNICYETPSLCSSIINLECCNNTKHICKECLNCLSKPLCPYCRKPLYDDTTMKHNRISVSEPIYPTYIYNHNSYDNQDIIINPHSFENTRHLRRYMRNHRLEQRERRNLFHSRQKIHQPRTKKQQLKNYCRKIKNWSNESNDMDELMFFLEE